MNNDLYFTATKDSNNDLSLLIVTMIFNLAPGDPSLRETVGAGSLPRLRPSPAPPEHGLVGDSLQPCSVSDGGVAVPLATHVRPDGLQHGALAVNQC